MNLAEVCSSVFWTTELVSGQLAASLGRFPSKWREAQPGFLLAICSQMREKRDKLKKKSELEELEVLSLSTLQK